MVSWDHFHIILTKIGSARTAGRGPRAFGNSGSLPLTEGSSKMRTCSAVFLALALAACGTTADVMRIDNTSREATDPSAIQVLLEDPNVAYTSIAMERLDTSRYGALHPCLRCGPRRNA